MSLSDTQQIMNMLTEIDRLLTNIEMKTGTINNELPTTTKAFNTFTKLERVALRYVSLSRRIAGTDNAAELFQVLSKILMVMQMLYTAGSLAFSGPFGLIAAVPALAMTQLTLMEGY